MHRIYLAGPDVFAPNAREIGAAKKRICARHGLVGVYPMDVVEVDGALAPARQGLAIYDALERAMRDCDAIVADMTPFRGPSMDVGTAFEMGYMRALGKPLFAYSGTDRPFADRVVAHARGAVRVRADGSREDADGMAIEEFDFHDNLMLDGSVLRSSAVFALAAEPAGADARLAAFERCVRQAAAWLAGGPSTTGSRASSSTGFV